LQFGLTEWNKYSAVQTVDSDMFLGKQSAISWKNLPVR